jgi:IS30 family transposase
MTYHQRTEPERYMISRLRKTGHWVCATARILGRHRSTIHRECKRNATRAGDNFGTVPPTIDHNKTHWTGPKPLITIGCNKLQ